jgi:hypothetical protein
MSAHESTVEDLVLHAPRVLGFASAARIADRYWLDPDRVEDLLLEYGARGWIGHSSFGDGADRLSGWHLTDDGRREDEARLTAELDRADARPTVEHGHRLFVGLNMRFLKVCTDWQVRPVAGDPLAANDHRDWAWDEGVLRNLGWVGTKLADVMTPVAERLRRFDGYAERYAAALTKVNDREHPRAAGERRRWVDAPDVDSCHTVWIQLHEDLLSTLGIPRGSG